MAGMAKGRPPGERDKSRISTKIEKLHQRHPEMPSKQRVAIALAMARAGRLGPRGGYKGRRKDK